MDEDPKPDVLTLVQAAGGALLGVWWISDGVVGLGVAWSGFAILSLASWFVRRRPGRTPWWARTVSWAGVRSRLRRA